MVLTDHDNTFSVYYGDGGLPSSQPFLAPEPEDVQQLEIPDAETLTPVFDNIFLEKSGLSVFEIINTIVSIRSLGRN